MIGFYTNGYASGKVIGKNIKIQERFGRSARECIHIRYGGVDITISGDFRSSPSLLPELSITFPREQIDQIVEGAAVENISALKSGQSAFLLQYQEIMRGNEVVERNLGWYPGGARIYIDHIVLLYCNSLTAYSEMQVNIGRGPVILHIDDSQDILCEIQDNKQIPQLASARIYVKGERENRLIMELVQNHHDSDILVNRYYRNADINEAKMRQHLDIHKVLESEGRKITYYRYDL